MEFVSWRPGEEVTSDHQTDGIRVVVGGVVKVVCESLRGAPITVELVGPAASCTSSRGCPIRCGACTRSPTRPRWSASSPTRPGARWRATCASRRASAWQRAPGRCCPAASTRSARSWRSPSGAASCTSCRVLAHEFGSPHPAGICIDLPLSHADLASLVGAARANVTRAVGALRADGLLAPTPGRLVLTGGFEGHA